MLLSPTLSLGAMEPPLVFVSRLAARNGVRSGRALCSDLGLGFKAIANGDAEEIGKLADLAGANVDALMRHAVTRDGKAVSLGGERLAKPCLRGSRIRVCAACLLSDIETSPDPEAFAPYVRSVWLLTPIRTCPEHSVALVEMRGTDVAHAEFDFAHVLQVNAPDFERLAAEAPQRTASDLEIYLLDRVLGRPRQIAADAWVDAMEWHVVARMSEVLGVVRLFGLKQGLKGLTDDQAHAAAAGGFEILRHGPIGLRAFFQGLFAALPITHHAHSEPQGVLGTALQTFLYRRVGDPAFERVLEVARDFIVDNFEFGEDDTVLGRKIAVRRFHSIASAAAQWQLHPSRVRKILIAAGVAKPDQAHLPDHRVLMAAVEVADVIDIEMNAIESNEVEALLGVVRPAPKLLKDAGLISTIPWTGKGTGAKPRFAKDEIPRFLATLHEQAVPVVAEPAGAVDPVAAAKACCSPLVDVLRLILDRKLAGLWRLPNAIGIMALAVMPDEVRHHLCGPKIEGLTPAVVEKRLLTSHLVLKALMDIGVFTPEALKHPVHGGKLKLIPVAQVEEFERTYVSLHQLTLEEGRHFREILGELEARGVEPVWDRKVVRSRWYRRTDVLKLHRYC
jgi:hypothetical protein